MERINKMERGGMEIIENYSTDILYKNSIAKDIIENFALISSKIYNIDYTNTEGHTDAFHKSFKSIDDLRVINIPDNVAIDDVTFNFTMNNRDFAADLSFEYGTITIIKDVDADIDFLPFLNDMEQKIQQKKTNGMKM